MRKLENLKSEVENLFKENGLDENIEFRISNIDEYDLQINNLVKHQDSKNIDYISLELKKILIENDNISNFEITKNYFINLRLNMDYFSSYFKDIKNHIKVNNPKNIILDYGGPNIGKPLHVGHLRSLNIGRSLYQINKLAGNNVLNDIHLGDWGMPVAQIICYMNKNNIDLEKIEIEDLEAIYPKASKQYQEDSTFKFQAQEVNKKLNENEDKLLKEWTKLKSISVRSIKETLALLNHSFDLWMGESDVNNLIPSMIDDFKKDKKISLDDGAYVSNFESDPKILITKSDGSYLYLTTDLATVLNRRVKNKVDKTLYIVDKRQKLHFEQLFNSIEYFQLDDGIYSHVEFGTVNDLNGNPFRTRDGDTKKLTELFQDTLSKLKSINKELDEKTNMILANTVLTFSDLITNRKTDYKFDLDKFTKINGKTGIYVQYAYVRARKLIQNSKMNIDDGNLVITEFDAEDEYLMREFLKFEYIFIQALSNNEPHHLADYLYELSSAFNSMYQNVNILENKNEIIKLNKLKLTNHFMDYSKLIMQSLGIQPIEKM
mgnify:CR=1 FL=1|tara:strand:- start:25 stop:1668 length:1644 start_codon:yes stop_codon:yes gene_type:complete